jgi:hypothetical protein
MVAQRKTTTVVNRPGVMAIPRGMQFKGTVQRAEKKGPAIVFDFADDIPEDVRKSLYEMSDRVPAFRRLCEDVLEQHFGLHIWTKAPEKGVPRAHYKSKAVYVNYDMDHDDMLNAIVMELTNAKHWLEFDNIEREKNEQLKPRKKEQVEYKGVEMQIPMIAAAKDAGLVKKEMFAGRWRNFEEYFAAQQRSGHTGLYMNQSKGWKCFITSACVFARGLPDDCEELTTLRAFRDSYIMSLPGGPELVQQYYEIAPGIVERIHESEESEQIFASLYAELVAPSVTLILNGEYEKALTHYRTWVARLMNEFALT